jgi:hypothetical protein
MVTPLDGRLRMNRLYRRFAVGAGLRGRDGASASMSAVSLMSVTTFPGANGR